MITIDVIKLGYKQDKDGFVISFRLHPNDDHDEIAKAQLGSQWQMKLVPLDDDGNPQDADTNEEEEPPSRTKKPYTKSAAWADAIIRRTGKIPRGYPPENQDTDAGADESGLRPPAREAGAGRSRTHGAASRPSHVAQDKRLIQQCALCCKDPLFQKFLIETYNRPVTDEEDAATLVRIYCRIDSRREIILGTNAAKLWDELYGQWLVWRRPEVAAS